MTMRTVSSADPSMSSSRLMMHLQALALVLMMIPVLSISVVARVTSTARAGGEAMTDTVNFPRKPAVNNHAITKAAKLMVVI